MQDKTKSWTVEKLEDGWYWYDSQGFAYGPNEEEEWAIDQLDGYAEEYDRID